MRNKFDMQLERLNSQLTHMGEMCEIAITRATKALEDGKIDEAQSVQEADEEIDQLGKKTSNVFVLSFCYNSSR